MLVALAILGVAAAGLIGAAETHVDSIRALEARSTAGWVAENRIAEIVVGREAAPAPYEVVEMLGQSWGVRIDRRPSEDPDLSAMTIRVGEPDRPDPLATMDFFVERPRDNAR